MDYESLAYTRTFSKVTKEHSRSGPPRSKINIHFACEIKFMRILKPFFLYYASFPLYHETKKLITCSLASNVLVWREVRGKVELLKKGKLLRGRFEYMQSISKPFFFASVELTVWAHKRDRVGIEFTLLKLEEENWNVPQGSYITEYPPNCHIIKMRF